MRIATILIRDSDFWFRFLGSDWKRNSNSMFGSKDSGRIFFRTGLLKNQEIGIPILKFGNLKNNKPRNSVHLILHKTLIVIGQPVDLTRLNCMDIGIIPGKGILLPIQHLYST